MPNDSIFGYEGLVTVEPKEVVNSGFFLPVSKKLRAKKTSKNLRPIKNSRAILNEKLSAKEMLTIWSQF